MENQSANAKNIYHVDDLQREVVTTLTEDSNSNTVENNDSMSKVQTPSMIRNSVGVIMTGALLDSTTSSGVSESTNVEVTKSLNSEDDKYNKETGMPGLNVNSNFLGINRDDFPTREELKNMPDINEIERITGFKFGYYAQFFAGGSEDIAYVKNNDGDWAILYNITGFAGTAIEAKVFIGFFETSSTTEIEALFGKSVVASVGGGYVVTGNYEHSISQSKYGEIHMNGVLVGGGVGASMTGGLSNTEYIVKSIDNKIEYNEELIMKLSIRSLINFPGL